MPESTPENLGARGKERASPARHQAGRLSAIGVAVVISTLVFVLRAVQQLPALIDARFKNPDSYYRLVMLLNSRPGREFQWMARDNWPDGFWMHWSLPYPTVLWLLHQPLRLAGFAAEPAFRYAGALLTGISMVLLSLFTAIAISRVAPPRSIMVSSLILATSASLAAYASVLQITHHIFMLVPLAAAAACVLQQPTVHRPVIDGLGGGLLGFALWVSPETMPFVVGLAHVRMALRLQYSASASLWPIAVGLFVTVFVAWWIEPPPPSFDAWALDHLSKAYLLLAGLLAVILCLADQLAARSLPATRSVPLVALASLAAAVAWMVLLPGPVAGLNRVMPTELQATWDSINELRPSRKVHEWFAFVALPCAAAVFAALAALRARVFWLAVLAFMTLAYAALGAWHMRMSAAAALSAALTYSAATIIVPAFTSTSDASLSRRQIVQGVVLALLPGVFIGLAIFFALRAPPSEAGTKDRCDLAAIAPALNDLPPSTLLASLSHGAELLYRTRHRIVAGLYHHNIPGMLDSNTLWQTPDSASALAIIDRRQIDYVLICGKTAVRQAPGSLGWRVAHGTPPAWLNPVPVPLDSASGWQLYRLRRQCDDSVRDCMATSSRPTRLASAQGRQLE